MAGYQGVGIVNATLSASVADLVMLTKSHQSVKVTNVTGTDKIYFTVSHQGGDCPIPTIASNTAYVVPAAIGQSVNVRHDGLYGAIVQLISATAEQYAVEAQSVHATS